MGSKIDLSDLISEMPRCVEWASGQDTSGLARFLVSEPDRPLVCAGSGGSYSVCVMAALLREALGGVAKAVSPYSLYSMPSEALGRCDVLLVSNSGANKDIVRLVRHCERVIPGRVANLTSCDSDRNKLKTIIPAGMSFNYPGSFRDGFIAVNSVAANYALLINSLRGSLDVAYGDIRPFGDLSGIRHFMILYGGWGEPVAVDLESKLVESGIATCAVSDYRNFCHGRFIFAGNHCGEAPGARGARCEVGDDCAVIMLATPREAAFAGRIAELLPARCRVVTVTTAHSDSLAVLDLLRATTALTAEIGRACGVNPLSPPNHGKIDKRAPAQLPFITDLVKAGPLAI